MANAWKSLLEDILKTGKEVGYCNCMCGCENNLFKLLPGLDYTVRKNDSPKMDPLTKDEIKQRMETNTKIRDEKKRRRKRRLNRKKNGTCRKETRTSVIRNTDLNYKLSRYVF